MSTDQTFKVKRPPYCIVPASVLTESRLSWRARVILSWMLGQNEGWELRVGHIRGKFGLSEQQWSATSKELRALGYFKQERFQNESGKIIWENFVTYNPSEPSPQKPGGGRSCHGEPLPGKPSPGPQGDIPIKSENNTNHTNIKETRTKPNTSETSPKHTLAWPTLAATERSLIEPLLIDVDQQAAQMLLDELAGNLEAGRVKAPNRWFKAVLKRYREGKFSPTIARAMANKQNSSLPDQPRKTKRVIKTRSVADANISGMPKHIAAVLNRKYQQPQA